MIHPADNLTLDLPGIEPAPRVERTPRTNAEDRKQAAGYMLPREVESCRNCRHLDTRTHAPDSLYEHTSHHCQRHSFAVKLGAICDDYAGRKS